ncbi:SWR1-complex protein 5 [Apiospora kogelbergensis]|uniref:SWR1-complex protein 5 n=1 Tax=Apiospora kogelbergensis TaxID=1337665 RepID=UPI00312D0944
MSTEPLLDEEYASEDDSDFSPDAVAAEENEADEASESEDDGAERAATAKRKRDAAGPDDEGGDYENSGDELIISKGKKRQKKHKARDGATNDDERGRGRPHQDPKHAGDREGRAQIPHSGPVVPSKSTTEAASKDRLAGEGANETPEPTEASKGLLDKEATEVEAPAMIKIKRTYNFAGKVHTEEKTVPRNSAEAKVYLDSLGPGADDALNMDDDEPSKRQPRKAFRSIFEPVIEGLTARGDLNLGVAARLQLREQAKAKKLNVVEKSRMDWAGFVDKAGIKDELQLAGKSKQSYTSRQDFLARVDAKRDEDARKARMAQRV